MGTFIDVENLNAVSTLWYVEGLGLVKETTIDTKGTADTADDVVHLDKELTAYTGLTPI